MLMAAKITSRIYFALCVLNDLTLYFVPDQVDEMLLRIYYLYQKSPKKLRELEDIHNFVKQTIEFDDNGIRPLRANGTRWIAHKTRYF